MTYVNMIFFTLVALGVLVTFHEFGHFWVARKCGVKVLRFSIGFGTTLFKRTDKHGTEFVIALLPLGGYVKMLDEREAAVDGAELSQAFNRKSVWQRIAIVAAGPVANFILAILIYWVVFLGGIQGLAPVIGEVEEGGIAHQAGLQRGDEIVAVDGVAVNTTQELRESLIYRIGETGDLSFTVIQSGNELTRSAKIDRWLSDAEDIDPVASLGLGFYRPQIPPLADQIIEGGAAEKAGLVSGDLVLSADGLAMTDWVSWVEFVRARPGQEITIEVQRVNQTLIFDITPDTLSENGQSIGQVGMSVQIPELPNALIRTMHYNPTEAFVAAVDKTYANSLMILDSIGKMLEGLISAKHLSGPITIAKVAGTSAQYGVMPFLAFLAFLSVSLGVLNLLPIPVLDGGHLVYYLVEAIKGSPVSEKIQMIGFRVGVFMVVSLMVVAFYNDLTRLFH